MGSAATQANALRFSNPGNVDAATPVNPMQQYGYDRAKDYESNLAAGTNEEITRELGRARDEISVGMGREGEAAMARGADPTLFRTRALESGKRDIHNLQGRLSDVALGRRAESIGLLGGRADAAASEQRMMHLGTMSQSLAEQRLLGEQAETQARLNEAPYNRLVNTLQTVAQNRAILGGSVTGGFLPARAQPAPAPYNPQLAQARYTDNPGAGVMQG